MTASPESVAPGTTVARFLDDVLPYMQHAAFPVVAAGRPIGLLTLSRVRAVPRDERTWTHLIDVACPMADVPVAAPDETLAELRPRLDGSPDGCALVLADGALVGIVSGADVDRALEQAGAH
jgi:CBS domain-containing protein